MARGWESKSVEEQQAESIGGRKSPRPLLTPAQLLREKKVKDLQLARAHVVEQLRRATNPRHRKMLEEGLADLEAKLAPLT
jgi:hypothetical protein